MSHATLETAAAWVLGELPDEEAERFEEHYFGCAECFDRARRLQNVVNRLGSALPFSLTQQRRQGLEARPGGLVAAHVEPGQRAQIHLTNQQALGLWIMHCSLEGVTRVDLEARGLNGELIFSVPDVPFDSMRGEVILACQLHYRSLEMPKEFVARLSTPDSTGSRVLGEYTLDHEYESL